MVSVTRQDAENYRFDRLYSIDLETAKQSCDLLDQQQSLAIRFSLLRDIVVTYGKPFSGNMGRVFRRHRLQDDIVPSEMKPLHQELLGLRDQAFAHTDHDFRDLQIARFRRKEGGGLYTMSFRNPGYEKLNERSGEIRVLIIAVEMRVNERIRDFELTFDELYIEEKSSVGNESSDPPASNTR
jgi:hypothetical protein